MIRRRKRLKSCGKKEPRERKVRYEGKNGIQTGEMRADMIHRIRMMWPAGTVQYAGTMRPAGMMQYAGTMWNTETGGGRRMYIRDGLPENDRRTMAGMSVRMKAPAVRVRQADREKEIEGRKMASSHF